MIMGFKLSDDPTLERDPYSKAIVSNDTKALHASRQKIKERVDFKRLQNDLNTVRTEISELKALIKTLVEGK